ncbi:MAG: translation initiation factor IF-2 [Desulfobulbaceae bacterium]|nr:translation initiation factor IF-2 [Desulfobulbaceae bacterium]
MSKVRIYELAKEAGLKSKELADKLIELGYPIKSHSSTVDEDTATDIRRKVLGKATVEVTEKRIKVKKRPEEDKRRTTVVRRRSKADKEELARQVEEAEAETEIEAEAEVDSRVEPEPEAASGIEADKESGEAAGQEAEVTVEAETAQEEVEEAPGIEEPLEEDVEAAGEEDLEEPPVEGDASRKPVKKESKKPRKLAKVVGKVDIDVAAETRPRPVRRPARPAPVGKDVTGAPVQEAEPAGGKGKKKGKRVVSIQMDDNERVRRTGKLPTKKGRQRVDFKSGGDVEFMRPRKGRRKKDMGRREREAQTPVAETKAIKKRIKVFETISVGDLAKRMGVKSSEVIARLMSLGVLATVNQALDVETATLVASDFGFEVEQGMTQELEVISLQEQEEGGEAAPRPPVVTVMGHVDHGKTSILDAIRKTDVAEGEAGGITQHIGAYHVQAPSGEIVFVDTPGHAAFTEMRSRGAKVTDIVVLVVAADDGVMEQTKEAIAHAKAAEVPIVVAVNKIDKDNADPERVKRELSDYGLIPEGWGGDTIYCETSAKKNIGIDELLENIQLQAEVLELKADPKRKARGTVIEAQLHKGRGPVATVLVQQGTLRSGDYFVSGQFSGKVRSLSNDRGVQVQEAGPSMPVEVQGLSGVPQAGDEFIVVTDEKMAKSVSESRQLKAREHELAAASKVSLDNLFEKMAEQELKELRVVLRADVQGTLEAFGQAAEKLSTSEIRVRVLHEGAGSITENDVHLAAASDAIIIGFNVRPTVKVKELAEQEHVDIRFYDVIYHALEDIEKAMVGMLEPTFEEKVIGTADVRQTFHVPKIGTIAGCAVIDGKIERNAKVRVLRDGVVIYTGNIGSLKRFKEDAKEVLTGYECGIGVENFNDIKVGDQLEAFVMEEVAATL